MQYLTSLIKSYLCRVTAQMVEGFLVGAASSFSLAYLVWLGIRLTFYSADELGIHKNLSGTAVYLDGESCVLDANPTITHERFNRDLEWCHAHFLLDRTPRQDSK